jgi:glycosyltransferase involved in cell wall biosynthesis
VTGIAVLDADRPAVSVRASALATADPAASHAQVLRAGLQAARGWYDSPARLVVSHHHLGLSISRRSDQETWYYIHTPTRFLWEPDRVPWEASLLPEAELEELRATERDNVARAAVVWSNSQATARRVEAAYGRTPDVLYPPVRGFQATYTAPGDYFVTVSRLVPSKGLARLVGATLPLPWLIIGAGREAPIIAQRASSSVRLLGGLSDERVGSIVAGARAYISPGVEDFGLAAAAAACTGLPLVVGRGSGVTEVVTRDRVVEYAATSEEEFEVATRAVLDVPRASHAACALLQCELAPARFNAAVRRAVCGSGG